MSTRQVQFYVHGARAGVLIDGYDYPVNGVLGSRKGLEEVFGYTGMHRLTERYFRLLLFLAIQMDEHGAPLSSLSLRPAVTGLYMWPKDSDAARKGIYKAFATSKVLTLARGMISFNPKCTIAIEDMAACKRYLAGPGNAQMGTSPDLEARLARLESAMQDIKTVLARLSK